MVSLSQLQFNGKNGRGGEIRTHFKCFSKNQANTNRLVFSMILCGFWLSIEMREMQRKADGMIEKDRILIRCNSPQSSVKNSLER